jgi:molybdopterin-guanine dinucleotide biosynthesis protein MobB
MDIPVYSFIAKSGTGKTTLIEKLIPELKSRGLRVAVMKHDAHEFDVDKPGKDSWRMTRAGADVTVIASATHAAVMENRPVPAGRAAEGHIRDVDVIITEGYQQGPWKKIGVHRAASGNVLPVISDRYIAVVADGDVDVPAPHIGLDDVKSLADFIVSDMSAAE